MSGIITVEWLAPDGSIWDLTRMADDETVHVLTGATGLGAVPVDIVRDAIHGGGTRVRHVQPTEKIHNLPLTFKADTDFVGFWRGFVKAITQTRRLGPGRLRITRPDSTWREVSGHYLAGLEDGHGDGPGFGYLNDVVLQLLAPDPWWHGPTTEALTFVYGDARSWFAPFPTLAHAHREGANNVTIVGDDETWPTWTLRGPFTSVDITHEDGQAFSFTAALLAGEWVEIVTDPRDFAVTDNTGANRIGDLDWPTAQPFALQPGDQDITVALNGAAVGAEVDLSYRPRFETA